MPATQTNARLLDPETSKAAGDKHENSGHAEAHRQQCDMAVYRNPGITSRTVAKLTGLERHEAARRLPESRKSGALRHCAVCVHGWDVCCPKICAAPETVDGQMRWYHKSYIAKQKKLF